MTVSPSTPPTARKAPIESARGLHGLKIGVKLTLGLGLLVVLLLLVGGLSYLANFQATRNIDSTIDARVPIADTSAQAQVNLLRMTSDVRGYLALGDEEQSFRESYTQAQLAFETDLQALERLSTNFTPENQVRFEALRAMYDQWSSPVWAGYPQRLFELRDDQIAREPAYRMLTIEGARLAGEALLNTEALISTQAQRTPSSDNTELLEDMAQFQGSFLAVFSGLRGYVTTRNRFFFLEYEANLDANQDQWARLLSQRDLLTPEQRTLLSAVDTDRDAFLELPPQIFAALESERWREDLFLYREETLPVANRMQALLDEMAADDQALLQSRLNTGRDALLNANFQTLVTSLAALLAGAVLALFLTNNISGPVRRLTRVAERVESGDLGARAQVESRDEIGVLAATFNTMTGQIEQNLIQIQREKKRADDLLTVVIPIGVALSSEKDFNRLLENILLEAKQFCQADAGVLYLRTEDDQLQYVIVRNDSQQVELGGTTGHKPPFAALPLYTDQGEPNPHVAAQTVLRGTSMTLASAGWPEANEPGAPSKALPHIFDQAETGETYVTRSLLAIPLKNNHDHTLGVLLLLNAEPTDATAGSAFDANLQQMMESFSSLAVAALEAYIREQSLRQEIRELRIEIDDAKRQKQVSEIVDTDLFQDLQAKARSLRRRRKRSTSSAASLLEGEEDQPLPQPGQSAEE